MSHQPPRPPSADPPAPRLTLRHLPLPAKLVLSTFLLAVGVGYTSAMVQLHMQHSDRDGRPLPTADNVVAVFAGKVWKTPEDAERERTPSKLEAVITGDPKGGLAGANMAPAFFAHDEADFQKQAKDPARRPKLEEEREGERKALVAWINSPPEPREKAYNDDRFALPKELAKIAVTAAYVDKANPGTILVRSVLRDRCARCHKPGGEKGDIPLNNIEELTQYMPATAAVPPEGGYVDSGRQMSLEKLTQSTHAHLLSFAVLFTCTGLIFAFTGLPGLVRGTVGPVVLLAQVADIACWWLARLPEPYGPAFAKAIIGTGAVVGGGLALQIVFGLFGMYGRWGRAVLVVLFAAAAGGGGAAWKQVVDPYLQVEKAKAAKKAEEARKRVEEEKGKADKKDDTANTKDDKKQVVDVKPGPVPPAGGASGLERVLTGAWKDGPWVKDGKVPDGGMVRAFFDKEGEFKAALKEEDADLLAKLVPQREAERDGLLAWSRAAPDARKKGYDDNAFPLPEALAGKVTPDFATPDGARLKVKELIEARCATCHGPDNKVPLDSYDGIAKFFAPAPAAAPVRGPGGGVVIPPARD